MKNLIARLLLISILVAFTGLNAGDKTYYAHPTSKRPEAKEADGGGDEDQSQYPGGDGDGDERN